MYGLIDWIALDVLRFSDIDVISYVFFLPPTRDRKAKNGLTLTITMALLGKSRNEVPPTIPSGVARMKPFLLMGLATLTGVYFFLVYALKDSV
jgi:hypothetical protein